MPEQRGRVYDLDWQGMFPCLCLLRTPRIAFRPMMIFIAALGAFACTEGWRICAIPFAGSSDERLKVETDADGNITRMGALVRLYYDWPWIPWQPQTGDATPIYSADPSLIPSVQHTAWDYVARPGHQLYGFAEILQQRTSTLAAAFLLLCLAWAVIVWSVAGAALTRIAAVALARDEQITLGQAIGFAKSRWLSYFGGPATPLAGVALMTLVSMLFSLILRIPEVGPLIGGIFWPLWLLGGVIMTLLLLGLFLGWPLMWATISCEGSDSFDALGRSYGYLFGRPLRYFLYALLTASVGFLVWYIVAAFAKLVVSVTNWAASWGAGTELMALIEARSADLGTVGGWGATLIQFWNGCILVLPVAFLYSYFWTATTGIYLLLRREEDAAEMDEIFMEDQPQSAPLPPLESDAAATADAQPRNGNGASGN